MSTEIETNPSIKIQRAVLEDIPRLKEIQLAAASIFAQEDLPEPLRSDVIADEEFGSAIEDGRVWLAVQSGEICGFMFTKVFGECFHLREIDVDPEFSRQGIGRSLIQHLASLAKEQGGSRLTLTTFKHVPWNAPYYQRLGFQEFEKEIDPHLLNALTIEAELGLENRVAMRMVL